MLQSSMIGDNETVVQGQLQRIGKRATSAFLEADGFFRSAGCVACAVGMCADTGELSCADDKVFIADRVIVEPAFENLPHASCVARLRRQAGARNMRRHAMMRHRSPWMVDRCRLRKPDIARIASQLAAFERTHNRVAIADLASRRVNDVRAALHFGD